MNIVNNLSEKLYIDEEDFILNEPRVKKILKSQMTLSSMVTLKQIIPN